MSRPLSDDERRAIDMRRVDGALDAFASTPIDQIDEAQFFGELDRALTPGNMRRPIETSDDSAPRAPKRPTHHDVGDAVDIDDDRAGHLLPIGFDDPDVPAEVEDDPGYSPVAGKGNDDADAGRFGAAHDNAATDPDTDSAAAQRDPDTGLDTTPPSRDSAPSADPGLNLSSGLRDLIARRSSQPATQWADDVNVSAASGGAVHDDAPAHDRDRAAATAPDDSPEIVNVPDPLPANGERGTATEAVSSPMRDVGATPDEESEPIPLRTDRGARAKSSSGVLDAVRNQLDQLPPQRRKAMKWILVGVVAIVILLIAQSCIPDGDGAATTVPRSAPPATDTVAPPTSAAEIPVPDNAIGTLAPSGVSARCPDGSTDARFAFTPDKSQAWICKRALGIDGAVLEMTFPRPVVITDVFLVPGFDYVEPSGVDRWVEHRVVTRAQWAIGSQRFIQEINPSRSGANLTIPSVETQKITLTIMETAEPTGAGNGRGFGLIAGKKDDSFAISTIRITGHQP